MNKRQTEKKYKRKWRQLLGDIYNKKLGIRVKPSRIKLWNTKKEKEFIIRGNANGYVLELRFTAKEGKDERSKEM